MVAVCVVLLQVQQSKAMRTWLSGAGSSPDDGAPTMALGIRGFIENQCGGGLINYFAGGASLQKACKAKRSFLLSLDWRPSKMEC